MEGEDPDEDGSTEPKDSDPEFSSGSLTGHNVHLLEGDFLCVGAVIIVFSLGGATVCDVGFVD